MTVYTVAEARQRLSSVLDEAERDGSVLIRRRGGREFQLVPVERTASPFEIESPGLDLSVEDLVSAVREARERDA